LSPFTQSHRHVILPAGERIECPGHELPGNGVIEDTARECQKLGITRILEKLTSFVSFASE
jgi:hypothetical protein